MAGRVVLVLSADARRQEHWQAVVRGAGHRPLAATTLDQARRYLSKVRLGLILADAHLGADRVVALLRDLRAIPPQATVPLLVVGTLTTGDAAAVQRDHAVHMVPAGRDDQVLVAVLERVLGSQVR